MWGGEVHAKTEQERLFPLGVHTGEPNGPGQSRGGRGRGGVVSETGSKRVRQSERARTHARKCTVWKKRFNDRDDSSQ